MKKLILYQWLSLGLLVQLLVLRLLANYPQAIEKYYSDFIYLGISKSLRLFFGWIPFSFGDMLIAALILYVLYRLIKIIKLKPKISRYSIFKFTAAISVLYFIFNLMWGLNYYRQSFQNKLGLVQDTVTLAELESLAQKMIRKTTELQLQLVSADSIAVQIPYTHADIAKKTAEVYRQNTFKNYGDILTHRSSKKSLFSLPLSYMGFAGYLNPITGEAQINAKIPKIIQPAVSCHETAHQLGIASEDEANFLGFMVAVTADDPYFKYSAYFYALQRVLRAIYRKDEQKYETLTSTLPEGMLKNMETVRNFWLLHKNPARPIFNTIYDTFLKVNQQEEGMKSYSKVVDLLVAYDREYGLF